MTIAMPGRTRLVEAILRRDFYSFLKAIFPLVAPNSLFLPNWHIEAMCHALMRVLLGETRRLIITIPPRYLKSICASVAFPAFVLGRDPRRRIICASYSEGLSFALSRSCRQVMRSPLYRRLFPHTQLDPDRDSQQEFATTKGGFRLSTSVGGTLTGRGGEIFILDDLLKAQDAASETVRDTVNEWCRHAVFSRLDNKTRDAVILVMQRLHVNDPPGHLLEQGGWEHLNLPAIADFEHDVPIGPGRVHHRKIGAVLHPKREPQRVLDQIRSEMGSAAYFAQYQQNPVAEDGNLIKWSWFQLYDFEPGRKVGDRIVVSWDTASSPDEFASFSVAMVLLVRSDRTAYVLDVLRERLEYPDLRRKALELHRKWRHVGDHYSLLIENKGSGIGLIQDLKRESVYATPVNPEGDKVMRLYNQAGRIEQGLVQLPRSAPWLSDFRRELTAFPGGQYHDQVDALSQALRWIHERGRMICAGYTGWY